jgi:hypothetical protein
MESESVIARLRPQFGYVGGSAPAVEAGVEGFEHFGKRCEVPVVGCEAPGEFPDSFDRSQLRAVWRQKQQP